MQCCFIAVVLKTQSVGERWREERQHKSDNVFNNVESFYFHSSGPQRFVWRCHHSSVLHSTDGAAGCSRGPGPEDTHFHNTPPHTSPSDCSLAGKSFGLQATENQLCHRRLRVRGWMQRGGEREVDFQSNSWPKQSPEDRFRVSQVITRPTHLWINVLRCDEGLRGRTGFCSDIKMEIWICLRAQWSGLHISGWLRQKSGFKGVSASNTGSVRGWIYDAGQNSLSSLSTLALLSGQSRAPPQAPMVRAGFPFIWWDDGSIWLGPLCF